MRSRDNSMALSRCNLCVKGYLDTVLGNVRILWQSCVYPPADLEDRIPRTLRQSGRIGRYWLPKRPRAGRPWVWFGALAGVVATTSIAFK